MHAQQPRARAAWPDARACACLACLQGPAAAPPPPADAPALAQLLAQYAGFEAMAGVWPQANDDYDTDDPYDAYDPYGGMYL